VFVVDPERRLVRERPVTVDGVAADGAQISDGLGAGDTVVTAGVQFLHDGMPVRVPTGE
jgi:multidrug efflux pump subunit AcrA (membrane-fusion protein)